MSATEERRSGAFASRADRRRWWLLFLGITALAATCVVGLVLYGNPAVVGSRGFWRIVDRRMDAVIAMAVVALCQAMATVSFQTVTGNRILTPSILGFESLYRAIHTTTIFLFGVAGLNAARTTSMFLLQLALMIGLSLLLYSWLLLGSVKGLYPMLLVGIIIGAGLGSLSTFMQRLLTPSEFDVLTARLFGSVNNADPDYYPVAIPLILGAAIVLYALSKRLNVLSLGRDTTTSLGVGHARISLTVLVLISVLMATSTALVGPMTFLGFLVATLAYQLSPTYDHRYVFPMAVSLAMLTLCGAYFLMRNVFSAQGVVSIIIEFVGGALFLIVLLRRGRL
ncbi:ABC transporter component [Actinomyces sp. Chiba101]|uniref:iron chelate uptake ABC transporter family permease subunit n=1 Tax=Actinomyces TaxID=1654 RepID=UPI000974F2B8|nr:MULTISPECIES: iron chelate uptake ABC transporter family permease subunit [Actinomyces]BAW92403.1 ABC transporter component [Actinomyces sp. Chiba101]GAV94653.1 iron ABC superfamily ATP binding cassette transporter permease protein [Actinomyces denticolens]SUU09359.1 Iron-uptake system permease protein FeuC [Actinomyces denticolens]